MRLIDADALTAKLKIDTNTATYSDYCNGYCDARQVDLDAIDAAPTIEPEVRHGRWIEHGGGVVATCSNCNASYIKDVLQSLSPYAEHLTRFCPNCGEPMDALKTCCCISDEEAKRILGGADNGS